MSSQSVHNLDNLLDETRQLKEKMRAILPSYTVLLKELTRLPDEFEGGFWASCVDVLLETARADYQKYQAQAKKADFLGKFTTLGIDIVLKAGGMESIVPPAPLQVGISISQSGRIEPALMGDAKKQSYVVLVTYKEFLGIAQRLKSELLEATLMPAGIDEIPKLIYDLAVKSL